MEIKLNDIYENANMIAEEHKDDLKLYTDLKEIVNQILQFEIGLYERIDNTKTEMLGINAIDYSRIKDDLNRKEMITNGKLVILKRE